LIQRGRLSTVLVVTVLGLTLLALAPSAVFERISMGLDSSAFDQMAAGSADDKLTAGRFSLYYMFAPEVLRSPLWGRGTGSAAWSTAVLNGWTPMLHPHNLYLRVLMDIGVLGLMLLTWFYVRLGQAMRSLANSSEM